VVNVWIEGVCKECKFPIIWTTVENNKDYLIYCSNPKCNNHKELEVYDDEYPTYFIKD
jgi:hypothetical protein